MNTGRVPADASLPADAAASGNPGRCPASHPLPSAAADPAANPGRDAFSPPLIGVYIHVPFCLAKCPYCDFFSLTDPDRIEPYLRALVTELQLCRQGGYGVDSIYFGGGTPSLLDPRQVARILEAVDAGFAISSEAEITLEVNPGTVKRQTLAAYRRLGINRVNIGLQSMNDPTLAFLGRVHNAEQGIDTYRWARESGFENVGLDLIYGVPGQNRQSWQKDLADAVALAPDHLACYSLTIEPGTPMAQMVQAGAIQLPDERRCADLFGLTGAFLYRSGYRRYEVSNYCRAAVAGAADRRSRHNRKYWTLAPYLGFGPAAHSFLGRRRWWNHRCLDQYLADLRGGAAPVAGSEILSCEQRIMEYVYLGLRQCEGIDLSDFRARFKVDFRDRFGPPMTHLLAQGLVETVSGRVRVTGRGMRLLERVADRLLC